MKLPSKADFVDAPVEWGNEARSFALVLGVTVFTTYEYLRSEREPGCRCGGCTRPVYKVSVHWGDGYYLEEGALQRMFTDADDDWWNDERILIAIRLTAWEAALFAALEKSDET